MGEESEEQAPEAPETEEAAEAAETEAPAGAEESGGESPPEDERSLVFIEPDAEERARVESLGEELGRAVWAVNPAELSLEMLDSLQEAAAIVVAWDLGGRPGLDWVEALSSDPRLAGTAIALAAETPTRALVRAAWRAGARSFLTRPYDLEEIRERLLPEASAEEAPEAEASAAEG